MKVLIFIFRGEINFKLTYRNSFYDFLLKSKLMSEIKVFYGEYLKKVSYEYNHITNFLLFPNMFLYQNYQVKQIISRSFNTAKYEIKYIPSQTTAAEE